MFTNSETFSTEFIPRGLCVERQFYAILYVSKIGRKKKKKKDVWWGDRRVREKESACIQVSIGSLPSLSRERATP